jgi:hypothetical protein
VHREIKKNPAAANVSRPSKWGRAAVKRVKNADGILNDDRSIQSKDGLFVVPF